MSDDLAKVSAKLWHGSKTGTLGNKGETKPFKDDGLSARPVENDFGSRIRVLLLKPLKALTSDG